VTVEVPHRYTTRIVAGSVDLGGLEGAVALAQQDTHRAIWIKVIDHGEVEMAVAIKVAHGHRDRMGAGGVALGGLEGTVALAQQDRHGAIRKDGVGHGEVEMAIAIKIPHRQRAGMGAGSVALYGLEGAVAIAQQDAVYSGKIEM